MSRSTVLLVFNEVAEEGSERGLDYRAELNRDTQLEDWTQAEAHDEWTGAGAGRSRANQPRGWVWGSLEE